MIKSLKSLIIVGLASFALVACSQQGGGGNSKKSKTLENTKKAGFVKCGVSQGLPGFSNADASGRELCSYPPLNQHVRDKSFRAQSGEKKDRHGDCITRPDATSRF
jgi:hypothetical protein